MLPVIAGARIPNLILCARSPAGLPTGQGRGAAHVVNVLMGKQTEKTESTDHDRLPTFGVGAGRS